MMSIPEVLRDKKTRNSIILFIISLGCFFINTTNIILGLIIHSIAMIPLAFMLGELTSSISKYIGEKKGGIINCYFRKSSRNNNEYMVIKIRSYFNGASCYDRVYS